MLNQSKLALLGVEDDTVALVAPQTAILRHL